MKKNRHNPNKRQNLPGLYGSGDWTCPHLRFVNGEYMCPETRTDATDKGIRETCRGNRHNCVKMRYRLMAITKTKANNWRGR